MRPTHFQSQTMQFCSKKHKTNSKFLRLRSLLLEKVNVNKEVLAVKFVVSFVVSYMEISYFTCSATKYKHFFGWKMGSSQTRKNTIKPYNTDHEITTCSSWTARCNMRLVFGLQTRIHSVSLKNTSFSREQQLNEKNLKQKTTPNPYCWLGKHPWG